MKDSLDWVLKKKNAEGNMLLPDKGVHWVAKKSLNRFAFFVKSDTILLFTNNGGIKVILLSLWKDLRIDQYVLALVLGLLSFIDGSW